MKVVNVMGKIRVQYCSQLRSAFQLLFRCQDAVEVLMTMNVSTPELRAAVQRAGLLLDASHWSRAIVWGTWVTFGGFTPILLYKQLSFFFF